LRLATVVIRFSYFCPVLVPLLALQPCLEAKSWADSQPHAAPTRHFANPAALFQTSQISRGASHRLASAADPTDPYIVAQATALNNDANQIFAFVRDKIVFQAYHGSVRGARGTLWSMGGNSLDRASLLIALLGAAGFSAQYVQGTITTAQEQTLLGSMFPSPSRVVGCIPPGTTVAAPLSDTTLQTAISDHYWVEYGPSNTPMDPNFPGAEVGTVFGTPTQTFTVANMPAGLKQMVTITLNVEMASDSEFFGTSVTGTSTVLTQTFESALLVGMPVTVTHTLTGGTESFLFYSSTNYTYTPSFLLGQGGTDVEKDPVVSGTAYAESMVPIQDGDSSFVSGIFLVVTAPNSQGVMETYQHTIVDRVGYANRQAGNLTPTAPDLAGPPPVISPTDVVTINVLPSLQSATAFTNQQTRVQTEQTRFQAQQAALAALPTSGSLTAQQQSTLSQGIVTEAYLETTLNELVTMTFASTADYVLPQLQSTYLSDAYYNSPRVIVGAANSSGIFSIDLMKRDIELVGSPGQNTSAPYYFEFARGMAESASEPKILNQLLNPAVPAIGISDVFSALGSTSPVYIDNTLYAGGYVQMPSLSANAKAYIQTAFQNNKAVIAPPSTPTVNGQQVNMWLEINQATGETVSMSDDGNHEAIVGWITVLLSFFFGRYFTFTQIVGYGVTGYSFAAGVLNGVAAFAGGAKFSKEAAGGEGGGGTPGGGGIPCWGPAPKCPPAPKTCASLACFVEQSFAQEDCELAKLPSIPVPLPPDTLPEGVDGFLSLVEGMKCGAELAQSVYLRMLPADPDVYTFLSSDIIPGPAAVTPGSTPSVNLTLTQDQFFTMPFSGGDVPTVFLANIQNTGPATQTFNLSLGNTAGYQLIPSVPSITVPAGQTGQIGICAVPTGSSAPPATLSASATAAGNPNVTSSNALPVSPLGGNLTACEVTNDKLPTVADVQQMVNEALGGASPANDLDSSGVVNVVDVQIVINSVIGNGCTQ
jgi:hypothetical protein